MVKIEIKTEPVDTKNLTHEEIELKRLDLELKSRAMDMIGGALNFIAQALLKKSGK